MALEAILKFQNDDSTRDLNDRFKAAIGKGVLSGGLIVPVSSSLEIDIQPFEAISNDGMLIRNTATERISVPTNQTTIFSVLARHVIGDVPDLEYKATEASAFDVLLDKDDHIVFGAVTIGTPTEVDNSDISYALRNEQDKRLRNHFRGRIESLGDLPPISDTRNRAGDFFMITNGLGDLPVLYGFNGNEFLNMTDAIIVQNDLVKHRFNLFPDEIHLTDDQADAALGSQGLPNITNRYVTENDTRLPTQNENNALQGSDGTPSSTNKYVTEEYIASEPTTISFLTPPGSFVEVSSSSGPVFVGNGPIGSANRFFRFLELNKERGYLNTNDKAPDVVGIFKDVLLTVPLNPSADADSDGFFSSTLYLQINNTIDTAFRVLYGKKQVLKTLNKNFNITTNPDDAPSAEVLEKLVNIKGVSVDTDLIARQQNVNLRSALDDFQSYLGSVLETNVVADDLDYTRLSNEPNIGSNFDKNVGIDPIFTFENTGLINFSYDSSLGRVSYASAVNLSSVNVGDRFTDGLKREFNVVAVDDSSDTVDIVIPATEDIPLSINTSVGTSVDGSIKLNNNPRDLLLSEMKLSASQEFIPIKRLEIKTDEFSTPDGQIAFGIKREDDKFEPRIVFFGGWENFINTSNEQYVRNDGANGEITITGFFTDLSLVMRRRSDGPPLDVSINNQAPTTISTSNLVNATVSNADGPRFHRLKVADGLPSDEPTTVSISINSSTAGTLDIFGIEFIRSHSSSDALLEPGRAFDNADILKRDNLDDLVPLIPQATRGRGGRLIYSLADQSFNTTIKNLFDMDSSGTPNGTISGTTINITATGGKLGLYEVNALIGITGEDGGSNTVEEIRRISNINLTTNTIDIDSSTSIVSGNAVTLRHIANTNDLDRIIGEEASVIRYNLLRDFTNHSALDFTIAGPSNRFVISEDTNTLIAGEDLTVTGTDVKGVAAAIKVEASGRMRITALCTRLDIIAANGTADTSATFSVDGSNFYPVPTNGGSARRITMFSNARYQSHELVIEGGDGNLIISDIILWGPEKEILSGFPNQVADLTIIAKYQPSSDELIAAPQLFPLGGVFHEAYHYFTYLSGTGTGSDWSIATDYNKTPYGKYVTSNKEGSATQFSFVGSAFELQYILGPDHGQFKVEVDGTDLGSVTGTIVGDYSGNVVDAYNSSYTRKNIGIFGMPFGYHTVRAFIPTPRTKNVASSDFNLALMGIYVVNDNGFMSFGFSRHKVFSTVVDTRNFSPFQLSESQEIETLDDPDKVDQRAGTVPILSGATSISIAFSLPFANANYAPKAILLNEIDSDPLHQAITITGKTNLGFTASWNMPLDSSNYKLSFTATEDN